MKNSLRCAWWQWLGGGAAALLLLKLTIKLLSAQKQDFTTFYGTGRLFWQGGDIYAPINGLANRYGPLHALVMAPFALLPFKVALLAWLFLNAFLMVACLLMAWRVLETPENRHFRTPVLWLSLALSFGALQNNFGHGQYNMLILALVLASLILARRHEWAAGLPLGISLALKPLALPILALFAWKGAARAALSTLFCALVFIVLVPVLVWGPAQSAVLLEKWRHFLGSPWPPGTEWGAHGLPNTLWRFLTPANVMPPDKTPQFVNIAALSPELVTKIFVMIAFLVMGAILWLTRSAWQDKNGAVLSGETLLRETGLWMAAALWLSPSTEKHHLVLLLPGQMALAYHVLRRPRDGASRVLLALSFVFLSLPLSWLPGINAEFWKVAAGTGFLVGALLRVQAGRPKNEAKVA